MTYTFKKGELPNILTIDWSKGEKWDCLEIPTSDLGVSPHETAFMIEKRALRQNVRIEWMIYEKTSKFYITGTGRVVAASNATKKLAEKLYEDIHASYPEPTAGYYLKKHYTKVSYSKFKEAIDQLVRDERICVSIIKTGKKGRPSYEYTAME